MIKQERLWWDPLSIKKVIQLLKIIPERELFGLNQADRVIARKAIKAIWKLALMK